MQALRFQAKESPPLYHALRLANRWGSRVVARGWMPWLALRTIQPPSLPGPDWLRVRPTLSGVCGSDIALLTGEASPSLSPFASFPAVLGHEIVGVVSEVGEQAGEIGVGERVVVQPAINCYVRGLEPCLFCTSGQGNLCLRWADGPLAPGVVIGYCRDLPGGWAEEIVVHRTQAYRVPSNIPDQAAVLVEPLSIALHGILKAPPGEGSKVLVMGAGTIGLCVLAGLRLLGLPCHVTVVARYPFQADMARKLGADVVVLEGDTGDGVDAATPRITGARAYRSLLGKTVYSGGFDWIYDCVGSGRAVDDALRLAAPGGCVMVVGSPGELTGVDWTFVWAHELRILGSTLYAPEPSQEGMHTFDVALRLLSDHPELLIGDLVTHRFPLRRWRKAIRANLQRGRYRAIKTAFEFPGAKEAGAAG